MKSFDLEQAMAGAPICIESDRGVQGARLLCADRECNDGYPVVLLVRGFDATTEIVKVCTTGGLLAHDAGRVGMAPVKREGWLNIYSDGGVCLCESEDEANEYADGGPGVCVACIKVEWEE